MMDFFGAKVVAVVAVVVLVVVEVVFSLFSGVNILSQYQKGRKVLTGGKPEELEDSFDVDRIEVEELEDDDETRKVEGIKVIY